MIEVKDWIKEHKEQLNQNDFENAYMRSTMAIPEVCFCLKKVLTEQTALFWRKTLTELRSKEIEVSLNDGKFGDFERERWGWEKI